MAPCTTTWSSPAGVRRSWWRYSPLVTLAGCVLAYLGVQGRFEHSAPARCGARQDPQTPRGGKQYGTAEKAPAAAGDP